jgi:fructoselysine 3-epimerase
MKYAFNTWAYSSFPAWLPSYPLDEAIRRIAPIGYDGVEIGCAAPHAWPAYLNKERRAELRNLLDASGLQAVSLLPTPGGGYTREDFLSVFKRKKDGLLTFF